MRTEILAVAAKEVRQTRRDPRSLLVLVVAPLLQLVLLGFAVNLDVDDVAVFVADMDQTATSRAFASDLLAGDTFVLAAALPDPDAALGAVVHGDAAVALVLPRGFGADVAAGRPVSVQVLTDGSNALRATVAQNAISAFALRWGLRHRAPVRVPGVFEGPTEVRSRVLFNPRLDSHVYFVPGVAATLLLVVTLVVTAMGLAREKEDGTLEQILVTPMPATALVLGKVLPYAVIGLFDLTLAVTFGAIVFDVPIHGDLATLYAGGTLYLLTTLGLGLFVATVARTQQQAFMGAFFLILPMVLLSGFMSPIANMPAWIQPLTLLDPVRHMVEVLRGTLIRGAGFADLQGQLAWLAGMGVAIFTGAVLALRRRLA